MLASLPKLPGDSPSRPVFLARAISEFTYSRESACRVPALRRRFRSRRCRLEEHTSELHSLMRIAYAVFCLTKKIDPNNERRNYRHKLVTPMTTSTLKDNIVILKHKK